MSLLYAWFIAVVIASIVFVPWCIVSQKRAREKGILPPPGKSTMEDVKRLALSGEQILAIVAYREITGASLKKAEDVVTEIIQSSKEDKNGEN